MSERGSVKGKEMRILALETSSRGGSIALLQGTQLLASAEIPAAQRTAQALAPSLAELLRQTGWTPPMVQLVVVTQGPGSFTGIRIGVTTAKTFAYAAGAEVLGVDTLAVLAAQAPADAPAIAAVMNAQRGQLFAASFSRTAAGELQVQRPTALVDPQPWFADLPAETCLIGDLGVVPVELTRRFRTASADAHLPRATTVGRVGWAAYEAGARADLWALLPSYYRASAAEEKRALTEP